jgi:N utilization substance protein A
VIELRSLAREAGYRSKVAVSCFDTKIDAVGACVGVRGARIRSIVDELAGERIDIVRWNDSLQVLVPNSMQPAEVEDVILCPMLGKVIVLVRDDQLSLAIGKKGQNVRLASKLVGWDINVMTQEKLDERLDEAVEAFSKAPNVTEELGENLVAQGFFTFEDLSVIEPDQLQELSGLSPEECQVIVDFADEEALKIEQEEERAAAEAKLSRQIEQMTHSTDTEEAEESEPVDSGEAAEAVDVEEEAAEAAEVEEEAVEEESDKKLSVEESSETESEESDDDHEREEVSKAEEE